MRMKSSSGPYYTTRADGPSDRPVCVRGVVPAPAASGAPRSAAARAPGPEGFTAVECTHRADVIPLAKHHLPDVVFLDAALPRCDAGQVLRVLERFAETRSVVVVLTCAPDVDAARLARLEASGALLVMVK